MYGKNDAEVKGVNNAAGGKLFGKILYVEDDLTVQKVVEAALRDVAGYELKICNSGKEVLESTHDFDPDLFLFDIMLPDMTGLAVLEELRKVPKYKDVPAIFISAKFVGHNFSEYRDAQVRGIIRKPFDFKTLDKLIQALYTGNMKLIPDVSERDYRVL